MSSNAKPVAPVGYFFRVCRVDAEGDIRVELRKKSPKWWNKDRSVCALWGYVLHAHFKDNVRDEIETEMDSLLRRHNKRAAIASFVGDYPPKEI